MTKRAAPKEAALKLVENLEDEVSYEEIIHKLYVLKRIEESLADVEAGHTKTHEEAREELDRWLE